MPTEKVYKVKNGKKVIQEKNSLPGYILIEAAEGKLTPEMIQSITGITNVIDFLRKANPIPLRRNEVNRILGKMDEMNAEGETL